MRSTFRLLASVKPGRYLEAGNPTGLTGLFTHPSPRSALVYLYSSTLDKLKAFPDSSVYRQSVESLTRHRLSIVEAIKPEGYDQWVEKARKQLADNPKAFGTPKTGVGWNEGKNVESAYNGRTFVTSQLVPEDDDQVTEWDGETEVTPEPSQAVPRAGTNQPDTNTKLVDWVPEPPLDASQISELEIQIGAGLIEEVVQVAEGELSLVETMLESKVWSSLQEPPPPGQWEYFARDQHTPGTQEPPT